ncbi:MAG: DUF4249 domain-containing protein [Bacteroidia bacterium]
MQKVLIFISFLSLGLTSCQDVIQVKLDKGDKLLVVDAFIDNSTNVQNVRLTYTDDYLSNTSTPPALGATVMLTDLSNSASYTFTPDGNGNYQYTPVTGDSMALVGHNYQLNVSLDGTTYTALSKLNRTTKIDTIEFKHRKGATEDTTQLPKKCYPYLVAKDTSGAVDYYWIKTYKNGIFYNGPNQMNVVQDAAGTGSDGLYFIPPVAFFVLTPGKDPCYEFDRCTIKIYSINADTYDFMQQMQTQMTNAQAGLFAVTPQNVKSNIKISSGGGRKAIGWFNMGAVTEMTVIAH